MLAEKISSHQIWDFDLADKFLYLNNLEQHLRTNLFISSAHTQDYFSLYVITEGTGNFCVDGKDYTIDNSCVMILHPKSVNTINLQNAKGYIVQFTEDFFSLSYNDNILYNFSFFKGSFPHLHLTQDTAQKISGLMTLMKSEHESPYTGKQKILRSYLNIVLFELEKIYPKIYLNNDKSRANDKILEFHQLIDLHYIESKKPSEYAEKLNLSPNYLNKLCKKQTGSTAGEIIRKKLIAEAKKLLCYTSFSISEISYELNFDSVSYFITFFKKSTGTTPEAFRNKN